MVERPEIEAKLQLEVAIMGETHIIVGRAFCVILHWADRRNLPWTYILILYTPLNPLGAFYPQDTIKLPSQMY